MLFLGFSIESPFEVAFYNCWHWCKSKGEWNAEAQLVKTNTMLGFSLSIRGPHEDHTGLSLTLSLFGYDFDFAVYNSKHTEIDFED